MALAGCAGAPPATPPVNLAGYPAPFREGYADGCASAAPGKLDRKDESRFAREPQYAQGWRDGYDVCRKRK